MLARVLFVLIVIVVALDIYALADIAFAARDRIRSLNKVLWAAIVLLVTPVGAILWFTLGKTRRIRNDRPSAGPNNFPNNRSVESETPEQRIARLEEELRKLDDEDGTPPNSGS